MKPGIAACIGIFWAGCVATAGEIRSWVDESGQLHFSDVAPENVEAQTSDIRPVSPGERTELRPGERAMLEDYEERGRQLEEAKRRSSQQYQKAQVTDDQQRNRQARCKYYQRRLHAYQLRRRRGYTRAEEDAIDASIQRYEMQTEIYCD
jgi:hypothetical protein